MSDKILHDSLSQEARETLEDFQTKTNGIYQTLMSGNHTANILICGKTGVGKSTLINAVFKDNLARTGTGQPVTQSIEEIGKPPSPIRILDSKGLELQDYQKILHEIITTIVSRRGNNPERHIHVAWLCINNGSARVEPAEIDLAKKLKELGVKVIIVLTQVRVFKDKGFFDEVEKIIGIYAAGIVMTRGLSYAEEDDEAEDDDGNPIIRKYPVKGLDELIAISYRFIPEAQKQAFANVISDLNKTAGGIREQEARSFVAKFSENNARELYSHLQKRKTNEAIVMPSIVSAMYVRVCYIYGIVGGGIEYENDVRQISKFITDHVRAHRRKMEDSAKNPSIFSLLLFPNALLTYLFRPVVPDAEKIQNLLFQAGYQMIDIISDMVRNNEETTLKSIFLRFGDESSKALPGPDTILL